MLKHLPPLIVFWLRVTSNRIRKILVGKGENKKFRQYSPYQIKDYTLVNHPFIGHIRDDEFFFCETERLHDGFRSRVRYRSRYTVTTNLTTSDVETRSKSRIRWQWVWGVFVFVPTLWHIWSSWLGHLTSHELPPPSSSISSVPSFCDTFFQFPLQGYSLRPRGQVHQVINP